MMRFFVFNNKKGRDGYINKTLNRERKQKGFAMTTNGIIQGIYGNVIRTYEDNPEFKKFTDKIKNRISIKGVKDIMNGQIAYSNPNLSYTLFEGIAKMYEEGKEVEEVITYIETRIVNVVESTSNEQTKGEEK